MADRETLHLPNVDSHLVDASLRAFRRGLDRKPTMAKVRVLAPLPFRVAGKAVNVGDVVTLPEYDLNTQVAFKRVERV